MTEDFDIRCNLDWTEDSPKLIFTFSPDIHPDNVLEISKVIEKTIMKKIDCMLCQNPIECDKKFN